MLSNMYANPGKAAALVGLLAGLASAAFYGLIARLCDDSTTLYIVTSCLVGFVAGAVVGGPVAYFIFSRIGAGIEARDKHQPKS